MVKLPFLTTTTAMPSTNSSGETNRSAVEKICPERAVSNSAAFERAVWRGKVGFVVFLLILATVLGFVTARLVQRRETEAAETHFKAIAERALVDAKEFAFRKRKAGQAMAGYIAELFPKAEQWPYVAVPRFQRIAKRLLDTNVDGYGMSFTPIVQKDQHDTFVRFAHGFYYYSSNISNTVRFPERLPKDTSELFLKRGIHAYANPLFWQEKPAARPNNHIFAPILQHTVRRNSSKYLLLDLHQQKQISRSMDRTIECTTEYIGSEVDCAGISENLSPLDFGVDMGYIVEPIYPVDSPNKVWFLLDFCRSISDDSLVDLTPDVHVRLLGLLVLLSFGYTCCRTSSRL